MRVLDGKCHDGKALYSFTAPSTMILNSMNNLWSWLHCALFCKNWYPLPTST